MNLALTLDAAYIDVGIATSAFSLIGCAFIIGIYCGFSSLRTTGHRLLLYLTICNIGVCAGHITGATTVLYYREFSYRSFPPCAISGAFTIVSRLSSYLWTCALSLFVCLSLSKKRSRYADKLIIPFHLVCWIFPIGIMIAALVSDVIGFDLGPLESQQRPPWCWIDRRSLNYVSWSFLAGAGWQWGSIIICITIYAVIQWNIAMPGKALEDNNVSTQETNESEDAETRDQQRTAEKVNKKLGQIPLIFILLQVWGAWGYLAMLYKPSPNWLIILQEIGDQGQGLANAILLCIFTPAVRQKLCPKLFGLLCGCGNCRPCKKRQLRLPVEMEQLTHQGPEGQSLMASKEQESDSEHETV